MARPRSACDDSGGTVQQDPSPTRRSVVTAGATAALGLTAGAALAGCGGSEPAATTGSTGASSTASATASTSAGASSAGEVAEAALADLKDIPVGGAISLEAASGKLIVAQPAAGKVVAFSAVCPHQACAVAPRDGRLVCPCHGSAFETATGKVLNGPAARDLTPVAVRLQGTSVVAG